MVGSKITRGRPCYTTNLDANLFQPLFPDVSHAFKNGDGGELGNSVMPGKMQAVHSSSALSVNIFQYWKSISNVPAIAAACGLCKKGSEVSCDIRFEEKYPINDSFGFHPNIDVVIHNNPESKFKRFAIECKFSEAYGAHKHCGLKEKYLDCDSIWDDILSLRTFSERISPNNDEFNHLHPAQLVKHILGMKRQFGLNGFRLLYLWYDVLGEDGKRHRDEVSEFASVAKDDGIRFHSITYQDLIAKLAKDFRYSHGDYIRYLTERYL